MRKRPDKFHVGQRIIFVNMPARNGAGMLHGWNRLNGEEGSVLCECTYQDYQRIDVNVLSTGRRQTGWRYLVAFGSEIFRVSEQHLRAKYDGDERSTWT